MALSESWILGTTWKRTLEKVGRYLSNKDYAAQFILPGGFKRFNALRDQNRNLKTLIAIGGWNEGSRVFSEVKKFKYC
jgi:GH18 family chitinase